MRDGRDGQPATAAGLFPAGEGAGYAGGIVSAAVDGIQAADKVVEARAEAMRAIEARTREVDEVDERFELDGFTGERF